MNEIKKLLVDSKLSEFAESLSELILPSIRITTKKAKHEDEILLGETKIGGRPDLPKGFIWPGSDENYKYSFISQINCKDISVMNNCSFLPKKGFLYFFLAVEDLIEGNIDFLDKKLARVIYVHNHVELERVEYPYFIDKRYRYNACSVELHKEFSMPPAESVWVSELGLNFRNNPEKFKNYWSVFLPKFQKDYYKDIHFINKITGYPDQIQGDLLTQASRYYNGQDGDPKEWCLLLQIDSEIKNTNMIWGDSGRLYYLINRNDLKDSEFSRCIGIIQS